MVALATVLCLFTIGFRLMAFGGSVTLCGMLPMVVLGYRRGIKWGVGAGIVFGAIQLLFLGGLGDLKWLAPAAIVPCIVLDFILAFGVLGLSGVYKNKLKPAPAVAAGSITALLLRYLCHFISGVLIWGSYGQSFFEEGGDGAALGGWVLGHFSGWGIACIYSAIYNALYMIPEIIITTAAAVILFYSMPKILNGGRPLEN